MPVDTIWVLCTVSIILSTICLIGVVWALSMAIGFKHSTHTVQLVPQDVNDMVEGHGHKSDEETRPALKLDGEGESTEELVKGLFGDLD